MNGSVKLLTQVFLLGAALAASACTPSKFSGNNPAKQGSDTVVPANTTPNTANQSGTSPSSTDIKAVSDPIGTTPSPVCSDPSNPNSYNIVIALDNTGSQKQTDPTFVRRTGAQGFVDQFAAYGAANPKAVVNMNVLSFNTTSIRSADGWLPVDAAHAATIKQNIAVASTNPDGNTAYSPALADAAALFAQIGPSTAAHNPRNYLVFLTDGLPNADPTPSAIADALHKLVANNDVAVIAIASGPQVSGSGEVTVRALALPTSAGKYPDLVGQYYRAASASDLSNVWAALSAKIASVCPTP